MCSNKTITDPNLTLKDALVIAAEKIPGDDYEPGDGAGGEAFEESFDTIGQGSITEIQLRHGSLIDGIKVFYGGAPTDWHGSNDTVQPGSFTVPDGHQITKVIYNAGTYVDGVLFHASPINGEGNVQPSEQFGNPESGRRYVIESRHGNPLRSISGRSGRMVDRLDFHFGHRWAIVKTEINQEAMARSLQSSKRLVALDRYTHDNRTSLTQNISFRRTVRRSHSRQIRWNFTSRLMAGYKWSSSASAEFGPVSVGSNQEFSVSLELGFSYGQTHTNTVTQERSVDATVSVPPGRRVEHVLAAYEADLQDVPVIYTVEFYNNDGSVARRFEETLWITGPVLSREIIAVTSDFALDDPNRNFAADSELPEKPESPAVEFEQTEIEREEVSTQPGPGDPPRTR